MRRAILRNAGGQRNSQKHQSAPADSAGGIGQTVNGTWPEYEEADLKANGNEYTMHMYANANHGFHNDSTSRYDEDNAELAWKRTLEFFSKHLT